MLSNGTICCRELIGGKCMKSDQVKKGVERAPHRSLFNALGMTEEELDRTTHWSGKFL